MRPRIQAAGPIATVFCLMGISVAGFVTGGAASVMEGPAAQQGEGAVAAFAEMEADGSPRAIGVRFGDGALEGLPSARNNTSRCFDVDGDGQITAHECEGDYELRLVLPEEIAGRPDIPFSWVMLNWNPEGHAPEAWHHPHFDVHFYIMPQAELDQIAVGQCGIFVDCAAFERARMPVPARYVHADHVSVDAVVGLMGNHLIDSTAPELNDSAHRFTHSWIFGAYDGEIIFYEVMLTHEHMLSAQSGCYPIKQPEAWQTAGWYPTSYCIRHDAAGNVHTVSMEDFVLREASQ